MKALMKTVGCEVAYRSGLLAAAMTLREPLGRTAARGRFQILTYHHVGDVTDSYVTATPVAVFERHIRYLSANFRVLSLSALIAAAQTDRVPARAIAITFDDGYADTFTHAYPVIRRYGVPVTVYLPTGLINEDGAMWNDRIGVAFRDTQCASVGAIEGSGPMSLATPAARRVAFERTVETLKRRPPQERDRLVQEICEALAVSSARVPRMLRWDQVQEMHRGGVEFGAHTVSHSILTNITRTEAEREIVESKRAIEDRLQAPVTHFAYPNGTAGDFDEGTKELVRQAGFVSAVSTIFGTNTAATDRYELRRGGPWEQALAVFATKLWWYRRARAGAYDGSGTGAP